MGIINSFRTLNENEKDLSKPLKHASYKVQAGDTYDYLASKSNINLNAEDQLRLINGDYPDKELTAGRVIKIIQ